MQHVRVQQRRGGKGTVYQTCEITQAHVWMLIPRADMRILGIDGTVTIGSVIAKLPKSAATQAELRARGLIHNNHIQPTAYTITQRRDGHGVVVRLRNAWGRQSKTFTGSFMLEANGHKFWVAYKPNTPADETRLAQETETTPPEDARPLPEITPPPESLHLATTPPTASMPSLVTRATHMLRQLTQTYEFELSSKDELEALGEAIHLVKRILDDMLASMHNELDDDMIDELHSLLK